MGKVRRVKKSRCCGTVKHHFEESGELEFMRHVEKHHHHKDNDFIEDQLEGCLNDTRVVLFLEGGIHVEGTVRKVKEGFVELVRDGGERVEVESNDEGGTLEEFNKFFVKISEIVGFGMELGE